MKLKWLGDERFQTSWKQIETNGFMTGYTCYKLLTGKFICRWYRDPNNRKVVLVGKKSLLEIHPFTYVENIISNLSRTQKSSFVFNTMNEAKAAAQHHFSE